METPRQPSHVLTQNVTQTHPPWHSPVPYLFGGLAAMLGLIAFALLILACSYWKLSGYFDGGDDNGAAAAAGDRDLEAGEGKNIDEPSQVFEDKFLVIMAGELKPTFLATPIWSGRSSSFGDDINKSCSCSDKIDKLEVVKQPGNDESPDQTH